MLIMPSVAMNGGIFALAIRMPLTVPTSAPAASAAGRPIHSGRPAWVTTRPMTTVQKVIVVPTDRSIPPVMMTNVTPIASTPLTAVATRIEM